MLRLAFKHLSVCHFRLACPVETQNLELFKYVQSHPLFNQIRNTAILKRKNPVILSEINNHNPVIALKMDDSLHIYDVIEETNCTKKKPIEVILTQPVEELGLPGDIVEVPAYYARDHLLLPGLAVYASPRNREKYAYLRSQHDFDMPSSRFAYKTVKLLESKVFLVTMNLDTEWQVEPWHVRVGFRKGGIIVPEHAIALPSQAIVGPNLAFEGKEFLVKVKINNKEEARVRFRVHHVALVPNSSREPQLRDNFIHIRAEPIFEEEAQILAELNDNDPEIRDEEE